MALELALIVFTTCELSINSGVLDMGFYTPTGYQKRPKRVFFYALKVLILLVFQRIWRGEKCVAR